MRKKVVLLGMGGTISSVIGESGLLPSKTPEDLIAKIPELNKFYDIEARELMSIDSSNLQPHHWCKIAEEIYFELSRSEVSGVVIAHGTDTMNYTASAIAFLIQNINKPIVFTGSQIPFQEIGSDGRKNIIDSIRVAAESNIAECIIVFNSKILRAVRTIKLREYDLNAFECVDPVHIGNVAAALHIYDETTKKGSKNFPILDNKLNTNVAILKIFPGMKPEILKSMKEIGYKGLILEAYGAGNVPIIENSLLEIIKELSSQKFTIVITSQCMLGTTELLYETGILANKAGALQGFDMIAEVALIKLMWVLNKTNDKNKIRELMHQNIVGEINTPIN